MFVSKPRRMFLEECFTLKFGRLPFGVEELHEVARQLAKAAIDQAIIEVFEHRQPGRTNTGGEVF